MLGRGGEHGHRAAHRRRHRHRHQAAAGRAAARAGGARARGGARQRGVAALRLAGLAQRALVLLHTLLCLILISTILAIYLVAKQDTSNKDVKIYNRLSTIINYFLVNKNYINLDAFLSISFTQSQSKCI